MTDTCRPSDTAQDNVPVLPGLLWGGDSRPTPRLSLGCCAAWQPIKQHEGLCKSLSPFPSTCLSPSVLPAHARVHTSIPPEKGEEVQLNVDITDIHYSILEICL